MWVGIDILKKQQQKTCVDGNIYTAVVNVHFGGHLTVSNPVFLALLYWIPQDSC